jgi:type I site-specific restriction endonuclease
MRKIFDPIRRSYVALTPEEWVRQHWIAYLIDRKGVPASRIAVEKQLKSSGQQFRFDLLIYDRHLNPWCLIECKKWEQKLSQTVLDQALRYNHTLQAPYVVISNGPQSILVEFTEESWSFLEDFPDYGKMPSAR